MVGRLCCIWGLNHALTHTSNTSRSQCEPPLPVLPMVSHTQALSWDGKQADIWVERWGWGKKAPLIHNWWVTNTCTWPCTELYYCLPFDLWNVQMSLVCFTRWYCLYLLFECSEGPFTSHRMHFYIWLHCFCFIFQTQTQTCLTIALTIFTIDEGLFCPQNFTNVTAP